MRFASVLNEMEISRRALLAGSGAITATALTKSTSRWTMPSVEASSPNAPSQTAVSAAEYLDWTDEEIKYWFLRPADGFNLFRQIAFANSDSCSFCEIARSASDLPVYRFRIGNGPKHIVLMSGMHGCEPSGPRGLLAILDALLSGSAPFGISLNGSKLLTALTIHVLPLVNPGGAGRYSAHFPDSWHGTWLRDWTDANKTRFLAEANQPSAFFFGSYVKKAPMRFSPEQIAQWEATGHVLGSSLTDDGLDMWFDWDDTRGRETLALKRLLGSVRPDCVVDFHNFMFPSEVFAPTISSEGPIAREEAKIAASIQEAWRGRNLRFHDAPPRPYPKPKEKYYEDYWLHNLGSRAIVVEVNGGMLATEGAEYDPHSNGAPLSRRESLESVVTAVNAVLGHFA